MKMKKVKSQRQLSKEINPLLIVCDLKVGGERGRVFSENGAIGALSATDWKDAPKVLVKENEQRIDKQSDIRPHTSL